MGGDLWKGGRRTNKPDHLTASGSESSDSFALCHLFRQSKKQLVDS